MRSADSRTRGAWPDLAGSADAVVNKKFGTDQARGARRVGSVAARIAPWCLAIPLLLASAYASFVSWRWVALQSNDGGLYVAAADLDFGTQWPRQDFRMRLPIRNTSASPVRVLRMRTSCACTIVDEQTFEIGPGSSREVTLLFDLRPGYQWDLSAPVREFSVMVEPLIEGGPVRPPGWTIRGLVRNPFVASPRELLITDPFIQGIPFPELEVSLHLHHDLRHITAATGVDFATARVERDAADPKLARLRIGLSHDAPVGKFQFDVALHVDPADGGEAFTISYPVIGAVVYDLETLPPVVSLGRVEVGSAAEEQLLLRTRSGRPFRIEGASAPDGVTWHPLSPHGEPRREHHAAVRIQQAQAGYVHQKLAIHTQIGDAPLGPAEIAISYVGVPATDELPVGSTARSAKIHGE